MAATDVEKRLNLSLDELISQQKKEGAGKGGKGRATQQGAGRGRGRGGRAKPTVTARENQKKSSDKRQTALAAKRGIPEGGAKAGSQKAGAKVLAVPVRGRGRGGRGGSSTRGPANGKEQPLHPASLKITIRNDRYVPAAEQQLTAVPWGSAAATSSGAYSNGQPALEVGGFYSHQPAAGALGGAAARRGTTPYTPVYAGGAYYTAARPAAAAADATTGAATMQARQPAQQRYDQSMARATYGSGSLRMDEF